MSEKLLRCRRDLSAAITRALETTPPPRPHSQSHPSSRPPDPLRSPRDPVLREKTPPRPETEPHPRGLSLPDVTRDVISMIGVSSTPDPEISEDLPICPGGFLSLLLDDTEPPAWSPAHPGDKMDAPLGGYYTELRQPEAVTPRLTPPPGTLTPPLPGSSPRLLQLPLGGVQ